MAASTETERVTRSLLIASSTSTPATSGRYTLPTRTSRTGSASASAMMRRAGHFSTGRPPSRSPLSGTERGSGGEDSPRLSRAASVSARYSAPESRCAQPSRSATRPAVELLPDAAGPSIAMTLITLPVSRLHVGTNSLQIREEVRIADSDGLPLGKSHICPRHSAQHRERHREPVILGCFDLAPGWLVGSFDMQVIAASLGPDPDRPQICRNQFEAIALLHAQLADFAKHRPAVRAARQYGEHRN